MTVNGRVCIGCNRMTPMNKLKKNKPSKYGRMRWCLDCENIYQSIRGRLGSVRKKVLERDKYKCVNCGMTDSQHRRRWNRGITVDHIDGNGRYSKIKNDKMSNLQTLCLPCHGRKDMLMTVELKEKAR